MIPAVHDLLSEAGSEALLAGSLGRSLPVFSGMLFERHLGLRSRRTDIALRCTSLDRHRKEGLRALAARWSGPGAERITCFLERWASRCDPVLARIETLWLELDCPAQTRGELPAVFLDLQQGSELEVLAHALSILGRQVTSRDRHLVEAIRAYVPAVELSYCGLMLSRHDRSLRLCVAGLPAGELAAFATHLGALGDIGHATVSRRIRRYATPDAPIVLHLDLIEDGCPGPTLGVELRAVTLEGWREILEAMVEDGTCSPPEVEEVLRYPGLAPISTGRLARALSRLLPHQATHIIKRINHVKLVIDQDGKTAVKVYLYLCYY